MAVATPPSPDHAPIARPRSCGSNDACRMARLPGVSIAAATPCTTRAPTSIADGRRDGARQRGQREAAGAEHEHAPPAEPVTERAAEQDQPGERERVAVEDPLQAGERGVEVVGDPRQGEVDDGAVEHRHARAEHGGQQHPAGRRLAVPQAAARPPPASLIEPAGRAPHRRRRGGGRPCPPSASNTTRWAALTVRSLTS